MGERERDVGRAPSSRNHSPCSRRWAFLALLCVLGWAPRGFAQGVPDSRETSTSPSPRPQSAESEPVAESSNPPSNRGGVGLVLAGGLHTGLSLGARLGLGDVGVELSGGYQPLFALWKSNAGRDGHLDLGSSAQFGGELYVTPWHPSKKSAVGLKGGYRYNTVLHHGFAVAITYLATLSPRLAFEGLAGAQIFPGAESRLRQSLGIPGSGDLVYASHLQYFEYGFELIWYPFD